MARHLKKAARQKRGSILAGARALRDVDMTERPSTLSERDQRLLRLLQSASEGLSRGEALDPKVAKALETWWKRKWSEERRQLLRKMVHAVRDARGLPLVENKDELGAFDVTGQLFFKGLKGETVRKHYYKKKLPRKRKARP
jgi:hypothetical protein